MLSFSSGLYLASALVLYGLFAPRINIPFYRPLLFHPEGYADPDSMRAPVLNDVPGRDVYFRGSMGQDLHGWYFEKPNSKYTVLFSHGNAGNLLNRVASIESLLSCGASVLLYDYQGFGNSNGKPTVDGICDDAMAAYDYLVKNESVSADNIVLYGESLGVAVTAQLSRLRQCRGLILQSGFLNLRKIAVEIFPLLILYPARLFPKPYLDTLAIVRQAHPPLLIIHGMLDEVVPFAHAEELFAAASEPKSILRLPNTAHNNISETAPDEFRQALREFFAAL